MQILTGKALISRSENGESLFLKKIVQRNSTVWFRHFKFQMDEPGLFRTPFVRQQFSSLSLERERSWTEPKVVRTNASTLTSVRLRSHSHFLSPPVTIEEMPKSKTQCNRVPQSERDWLTVKRKACWLHRNSLVRSRHLNIGQQRGEGGEGTERWQR